MLVLKLQHGPDLENMASECSRRVVLQGVVAAIVATPVILEATYPASAAKMSKASAGYQSHPKGSQGCANCKLFVPSSSCIVVEGPISPDGWCRLWVPK